MEKEEEEVMSNNVKEMKEDKIEEEEETQWIQVENGWKERGSGRIFTICDIRCLYCRHYSRSRNFEGCTKCENNRCPRCKDLNLSGKCSECYKLFLIKCMKKQKKTVEN